MGTVGRFVGKANVAKLACLDQLGHGLELLVNGGFNGSFGWIEIHHAEGWHMALWPVNLIQVNHICLQALEAGIA